jgi:hypothetical protein
MISDAAIAELKARNPCDKIAGQWVRLRAHGKKLIGPCPLHSPDPEAKDSTSFECDAEGWVCASCHDGGDVIRLVALRHGLDPRKDFLEAVKLLGGIIEPSAERTAELAREREIRKNKRERDTNEFRERERRTGFDMWHAGERYPFTPVEKYLQLRGLERLPDRLQLRYAPVIAYFHGEETGELGRRSPRVVHRGPAMLAPIVDAGGIFRGVHITWIDLAAPNGKAIIRDPDNGDPLPAKKVRGSQAGNVIRLVDVASPAQLYIGEGIETVLSAWSALKRADRDLAGVSFWSSISLGNLAGKAVAAIAHPTLKDARGRARRVPGRQPDFDAPSIGIPNSVTDVVLLGDGDSDRFTTHCALARASLRFGLAPAHGSTAR